MEGTCPASRYLYQDSFGYKRHKVPGEYFVKGGEGLSLQLGARRGRPQLVPGTQTREALVRTLLLLYRLIFLLLWPLGRTRLP